MNFNTINVNIVLIAVFFALLLLMIILTIKALRKTIKKENVDYERGRAISIVKLLQKEYDIKIVYLSVVGSKLFGSDTPESDTDYRGVFIPSVKSCITGKRRDNITFKTNNNENKNNNNDIDIQLWSIQYFLGLLSKGDVNALDLLFSYTNKDAVITITEEFKRILASKKLLFNMKDAVSYIGFSRQQAEKYGIKGKRYGKIKEVCEYVINLNLKSNTKFGTVINDIVEKFGEFPLCFATIRKDNLDRDSLFLELCGALHQETITVKEFIRRVKPKYENYGNRAKLAETHDGEDYKALSHAIRCLRQLETLFTNGEIIFPLPYADYLREIKLGNVYRQEIEDEFNNKADNLTFEAENNIPDHEVNEEIVERFIMMFYN
jgi:predicted nucleotidyltransferase